MEAHCFPHEAPLVVSWYKSACNCESLSAPLILLLYIGVLTPVWFWSRNTRYGAGHCQDSGAPQWKNSQGKTSRQLLKCFFLCLVTLVRRWLFEAVAVAAVPRTLLLLRFLFALSNLEVARLKEEEEETPKKNVSKRNRTERTQRSKNPRRKEKKEREKISEKNNLRYRQCVQMLWFCAKVAHFDPLSRIDFWISRNAREPKKWRILTFSKFYVAKFNFFFKNHEVKIFKK